MKFLDLFAGIGGFRLGMEAAGHECVGYVEWDKYARKSYEAIHNTEGEWTAHDITKVTDDDLRLLRERGIDIICGGFPCQSFSIAGRRLGFEDTRGTLFFEIARFAKIIKPQHLFLENVKGLLNHEGGKTFRTILTTLDELGYDAEWQVLNSKNFGVPQNRERVFIIGHLRGTSRRKIFPIQSTTWKIGSSIKRIANSKYYRRVYQTFDIQGSCEALDTMQGGGRQPCIMVNDGTLKIDIPQKVKIRKLTPKECWRLQGFSDSAFEKAEKVNSNSQLYKQAGNSVTVNVIYEIAKKLV